MERIDAQAIMTFEYSGTGRQQLLISTTVVGVTPILLKLRAAPQHFVLGFAHGFGGRHLVVTQIIKSVTIILRMLYNSTAQHAFLQAATHKVFDARKAGDFLSKGNELRVFHGGLIDWIGLRRPIDRTVRTVGLVAILLFIG